MGQEIIKRIITKYFELKENVNSTYQNVRMQLKQYLRENLQHQIPIIRKEKVLKSNDLSFHHRTGRGVN